MKSMTDICIYKNALVMLIDENIMKRIANMMERIQYNRINRTKVSRKT